LIFFRDSGTLFFVFFVFFGLVVCVGGLGFKGFP
jgi:hypothetical protein